MGSLKFGLTSLLFLVFISCGGTSKTSTDSEDLGSSDAEISLRIADLKENIEENVSLLLERGAH